MNLTSQGTLDTVPILVFLQLLALAWVITLAAFYH